MSWENLAAISNSAFTTSLVGALAGAYAGAYAAHKISERSKERADFQTQIRNTNAAITLSFMVFNAAISLKKQQTKGLCDTYFKKKAELPRWPVQIPPSVATPNSPRQGQWNYDGSVLMASRLAASLSL